MPASARVSGTFRNVTALSCRVSGTWRNVSDGFVRVAGAWKPFFSSVPSTFVLLNTQVLTGNQTTVTFAGLGAHASTYKHLQIRALVRTNINAVNDTVIMRVNGNSSSASYRSHSLVGTGGVVVSEDYSTLTGIFAAQALGATAAASSYDAVVLDILDAFSTTKNKTTRRLSGNPNVPRVWLTSGVWLNTSSITSLDILSNSGSSFVAGTRFSLYGVK